MKRKRAEEYYSPVLLCPLCEHLEGIHYAELDDAQSRMIDHIALNHDDEEAISMLGWIGLYPEEEEE